MTNDGARHFHPDGAGQRAAGINIDRFMLVYFINSTINVVKGVSALSSNLKHNSKEDMMISSLRLLG